MFLTTHLSVQESPGNLKKDEGHDSLFLATILVLLYCVWEEVGDPSVLQFSTEPQLQEARSTASTVKAPQVSSTLCPRSQGRKFSRIFPNQSHVWSDSWTRKEPVAHCKARVHSRRGKRHAASCCPKSQSRGCTESEGYNQAHQFDTSRDGAPLVLVVVPMWRVVGFPPCCGPCSCTEARLHLSATVLRSTTLASQSGHSPQPLWGWGSRFHRKAPGSWGH